MPNLEVSPTAFTIGLVAGFCLTFILAFAIGHWLGKRKRTGQARPAHLSEHTAPTTNDPYALENVEHHKPYTNNRPTITRFPPRQIGPAQVQPKAAIPSSQTAPREGIVINYPRRDTLPSASRTHQFERYDVAPSGLVHTSEFDAAFSKLESDGRFVFVTGEAGTGKSTLLKYFANTTTRKVVIVAPTGVAALNVNGTTIHSFFGFPPMPFDPKTFKYAKKDVFKAIDVLIIDEISMVRADIMDSIDQCLRANGRNSESPFGGTNIVCFGDLFQLPPVVKKDEEGQFFTQYYKSAFFFDAHAFDHISIEVVKLTTQFRQKDPQFIRVLNKIRINRADCDDLSILNQRVEPNFEPGLNDGCVVLASRRDRVKAINQVNLGRLTGASQIYQGKIEGKFDEQFYPTLLSLELKEGAQVMMLANDPGHRFVNGTLGTVEELVVS